jgi:hypothetical protein
MKKKYRFNQMMKMIVITMMMMVIIGNQELTRADGFQTGDIMEINMK